MLDKKQVKAFLEVMSSDIARPVLCNAYISVYEEKPYMVATNSYTLAAIVLPDEMTVHNGKFIARADLIKWYKLADNKSMFSIEDIRELAAEPKYEMTYPDWTRLIPSIGQKVLSDRLYCKPEYLLTMYKLAKEILPYQYYSGNINVASNDKGIYVVCGLKPEAGHMIVSVDEYEQLKIRDAEAQHATEAVSQAQES